MAAAAISTVGCAKTRHQHDARVGLVHFAFVTLRAHDAGDTRFHRVKQVVDMPAQCLVIPHVSGDARFEIALCRSGVDVIAGWKIKLAQAADLQAYRLVQVDVELVGAQHGGFVWPGGRLKPQRLRRYRVTPRTQRLISSRIDVRRLVPEQDCAGSLTDVFTSLSIGHEFDQIAGRLRHHLRRGDGGLFQYP